MQDACQLCHLPYACSSLFCTHMKIAYDHQEIRWNLGLEAVLFGGTTYGGTEQVLLYKVLMQWEDDQIARCCHNQIYSLGIINSFSFAGTKPYLITEMDCLSMSTWNSTCRHSHDAESSLWLTYHSALMRACFLPVCFEQTSLHL